MALLFDAKGQDDAKELYDAKGIMHLAASPPNQPASSLLALALNLCRSICLTGLPASAPGDLAPERAGSAAPCPEGSGDLDAGGEAPPEPAMGPTSATRAPQLERLD